MREILKQTIVIQSQYLSPFITAFLEESPTPLENEHPQDKIWALFWNADDHLAVSSYCYQYQQLESQVIVKDIYIRNFVEQVIVVSWKRKGKKGRE